MSASTQALESGASGGMNLEGWCVLAMAALFGLFLLGVWWELRSNLRSISRQAQKRERAAARLESKAAFERELAREAASKRMAALRTASVPEPAQVLAESPAQPAAAGLSSGLGLESVGRILERLAQAAPQIEDEVEAPSFGVQARPALNMVRGGPARAESKAGEGAEDELAASGQAAPCRSRSGASGSRGKARDGVKSSSIGSSSIGSSSIGSGALIASR